MCTYNTSVTCLVAAHPGAIYLGREQTYPYDIFAGSVVQLKQGESDLCEGKCLLCSERLNT